MFIDTRNKQSSNLQIFPDVRDRQSLNHQMSIQHTQRAELHKPSRFSDQRLLQPQ